MTKQDKQTMRIKEKIKDEFDKVNERGRFDEDFEEKILDLVDVLISTTRREAVEDFAKWYDNEVFPEKGYAESMASKYLKESKQRTSGKTIGEIEVTNEKSRKRNENISLEWEKRI